MMSRKHLGREEQAKLEVGHTEISRAQKWVLSVAFLTLIFAVPVAQHVHEVAVGGPTTLGRFLALPHNAANVLDGDRQAGGEQAAAGVAAGPGRSLSLDAILRANSVLLRDINRFEDDLVSDSLLTRNLLPPVQSAMTALLGAGNEKAYVGRAGWLFYRPDVDYVTGPGFLSPRWLTARAQSGTEWQPAPQPDPLIAVFQFRGQLAQRGIALIIVPTPTKPVVHPEMFSPGYAAGDGPVQNASYEQFLAELANPDAFFARYQKFLADYQNVPEEKARNLWHWQFRRAIEELAAARELLGANPTLVFDPAGELIARKQATGQPQYLQTDTHWRPEAMELVAERLAEFIRASELLPPVGPAGYQQSAAEVRNLGDVAVMMKLPPGQTLYPPQQVEVKPVTRGENAWRPDSAADVLLLGDSFSNIYSADNMGWGDSAGLVEQLSFHLQRPIDAIIRNDAGASATRQILSQELARGIDRLAGKKLVIWQFAVRELSAGDWSVDSTPMRLGPPRPSRLLELADPLRRPLGVRGTVRQASPAPRPGTVTYPDHVVHVHLCDVEADDGTPLPAGEALVAIYSMRNQVWTEAARYRPGQRVHLALHDFEDADRRLNIRTIKSSMLEGDLALETPCWAEPIDDSPAAVAGAADVLPNGGLGWPEAMAVLAVLLCVLGVVRLAEVRERRLLAKGIVL